MLTRRALLRGSAILSLAPVVPASCRGPPARPRPSATAACWSCCSSTAATTASTPSFRSAMKRYARHRRELRLPTDKLLKIGDGIGLHPAMRPAADLFESGRLAIVQGVGYPNPNRSHFESMAIWQTARPGRPGRDEAGMARPRPRRGR